MKEYKVEYHYGQPSHYGKSPIVLLIEAQTKEDAEAVARDHHTRSGRGDGKYIRIIGCEEYQRPHGRVVSF